MHKRVARDVRSTGGRLGAGHASVVRPPLTEKTVAGGYLRGPSPRWFRRMPTAFKRSVVCSTQLPPDLRNLAGSLSRNGR